MSAAKPCLKTDLDIHFTHAANVCNYRSKLFKSGLEVELFLIVMTGQITDFQIACLKRINALLYSYPLWLIEEHGYLPELCNKQYNTINTKSFVDTAHICSMFYKKGKLIFIFHRFTFQSYHVVWKLVHRTIARLPIIKMGDNILDFICNSFLTYQFQMYLQSIFMMFVKNAIQF